MSSQNFGQNPPGYPPGPPPGGSPPGAPPGSPPGGYPPGSPPGYPPGAPPGSPYGAPPGQPAGQPPPMAAPPPGGYPVAPPPGGGSDLQKPKNDTMAIVSIASGIAAILCIFPGCCCYLSFIAPLPGIAAVVTGFLARKNIERDPVNLTGDKLALVGMICGGASVVLFLVFVVLYILGIAGGVMSDMKNQF